MRGMNEVAHVSTGLDVLVTEQLDALRHARVGVLTNPTGVTTDLRQNFLVLRERGVNIAALFSPEHGIAASAREGERVTSGMYAGLPVFSLYGETRKPTCEMLGNVDVLLFDLQDVGVRFYTYTATLGLALEACAECGKRLIVLDRPNPITGMRVEGPLLDPALQSFVGYTSIPLRYGLTLGELAQFYNRTLNIGADLQVIAMHGWRRELWFDHTDLIWVPPSPNIPHFTTTLVYPGTCLVEGTNLSLGRGTQLPFEVVAAPWVDGDALAEELNALNVAGVRFRACAFTPSANKFANEPCFGVQVHVTDRDGLWPVAMGLQIISTLRKMYPAQFAWRAEHFDRLVGDASVRGHIERGESIAHITSQWAVGQQAFQTQRQAAWLYE